MLLENSDCSETKQLQNNYGDLIKHMSSPFSIIFMLILSNKLGGKI